MTTEIKKLLGLKIRTVRKARKMTVKELAEKSKLARVTIANIESGLDAISINNLYRISKALEIDILKILPSSDFFFED